MPRSRACTVFGRAARISVAAFVFLLALGAANDIEAVMFPVAETRAIDITSRTDTTICWTKEVVRLREATPVYSSWRAWDVADPEKQRSAIALAPYDPDTRNARLVDMAKDKGYAGPLRQCVDLPKSLQGADKTLTFSARVDFAVWHGLWTVPTFVGPFTVRANAPTKTIELPNGQVPTPQQFRLHGIPAVGNIGKPLLGYE